MIINDPPSYMIVLFYFLMFSKFIAPILGLGILAFIGVAKIFLKKTYSKKLRYTAIFLTVLGVIANFLILT